MIKIFYIRFSNIIAMIGYNIIQNINIFDENLYCNKNIVF